MENYIMNPVLRGFNPDPSILRVNDDYYIATSTFQWFPGVQIHHSKDLIHWEFVCRPLDSRRLLDLTGIPDSGGVWAPCLTYCEKKFYLVYSIVKNFTNYYKDVDNYLVTADQLEGPWSDPVYLNSSGFDPSLFHDFDGKKYLLNQLFNHRDKENQFLGIVLQEYDPKTKQLTGKAENIFQGSKLGVTEGPHLYKIGDYYYLVCAEGGTFYEHAVTVARSKNIWGPYELSPYNPLITSYGKDGLVLQKSGHGSFVLTQNGELYIAHLCARPNHNNGRCMLGRETALQKLIMTEDGWPRMWDGSNDPKVKVPAPELPLWRPEPRLRGHFDGKLPDEFQTLREPPDQNWLRFEEDSLVLEGRASMECLFQQSLIGRRREDFVFCAETVLEFAPDNYQQMAGMALYYDTSNYVYLTMTYDEQKGRILMLLECDAREIKKIGDAVPIDDHNVYLRMEIDNGEGTFMWSRDGTAYEVVGKTLDVTHLSDDYSDEKTTGLRFTGTFVALCCQDVSGSRKTAKFRCFDYKGCDIINYT